MNLSKPQEINKKSYDFLTKLRKGTAKLIDKGVKTYKKLPSLVRTGAQIEMNFLPDAIKYPLKIAVRGAPLLSNAFKSKSITKGKRAKEAINELCALDLEAISEVSKNFTENDINLDNLDELYGKKSSFINSRE